MISTYMFDKLNPSTYPPTKDGIDGAFIVRGKGNWRAMGLG